MCLDTKWKGWLTAAFVPSETIQWLEKNQFFFFFKKKTQNVNTPNNPKKYKKVSEGKKYSFNNVVGS